MLEPIIASHSDLSEMQKLQLHLIYYRRFNQFDGPLVVKDLLKNKSLWQAALMTRVGLSDEFGNEFLGNGITLRDLPGNHYNVDTLYLSTAALPKLKKLVKNWLADEISEVEEPGRFLGTSPTELKVLRLWWD